MRLDISSYHNSIYKSLVSQDTSMTIVTGYRLDHRSIPRMTRYFGSFFFGQTGSEFDLMHIAIGYDRNKRLEKEPGHPLPLMLSKEHVVIYPLYHT
jgi:hypothetical protein